MLRDKNQLGMIAFIAGETIFFGMLIMAFVYFRLANPNDFRDSSHLQLTTTAIFTVFLLTSSLTIWFSERSLHNGNRRGFIIWLLITIGLGVVFLGGQAYEYLELISENITISRNTFGTSFYTLTAFHGLHVAGGLIALGIIAILAFMGDFRTRQSSAVNTVSLYWHFVDVVWIAVFTTVYLVS
jgi:heme/copper-type cytochrome/quinol oxidase subunit 3